MELLLIFYTRLIFLFVFVFNPRNSRDEFSSLLTLANREATMFAFSLFVAYLVLPTWMFGCLVDLYFYLMLIFGYKHFDIVYSKMVKDIYHFYLRLEEYLNLLIL